MQVSAHEPNMPVLVAVAEEVVDVSVVVEEVVEDVPWLLLDPWAWVQERKEDERRRKEARYVEADIILDFRFNGCKGWKWEAEK